MKKLLSLILAATMIMSCFTGITISVSAKTEQRLNLNTEYAYSYPSHRNVTGDNEGKALTDGDLNTASTFKIANESIISGTRKDTTVELDLYFEGREPHYYIQNNFGFVSNISKVEFIFDTANGSKLPLNIDIFISND